MSLVWFIERLGRGEGEGTGQVKVVASLVV